MCQLRPAYLTAKNARSEVLSLEKDKLRFITVCCYLVIKHLFIGLYSVEGRKAVAQFIPQKENPYKDEKKVSK